jgi:hypothetical protein
VVILSAICKDLGLLTQQCTKRSRSHQLTVSKVEKKTSSYFLALEAMKLPVLDS